MAFPNPPGARAPKPERPNYLLKFDQGIGFYWAADGVTHFLVWTRDPREQAEESGILKIPAKARFYSYGLNFSQASAVGRLLPPHVLGFGISYREPSGQYRGRWPVHFVPIIGYDRSVYEIVPANWPHAGLQSGDIEYDFWSIEVATPGGDAGYLFRFATDEYEATSGEYMDVLEEALRSSDRWHHGTLVTQSQIRDPQLTEFEIRFARFDRETREMQAVLRGGEGRPDRLEGELLNARRLVLRDPETEAVWDFDHLGSGYLSASYRTGFDKNSVSLTLTAADEAGDSQEE